MYILLVVLLWWGTSSLCAIASRMFFTNCMPSTECAVLLTAGQLLLCALAGGLILFIPKRQSICSDPVWLRSVPLQGVSLLHLLITLSTNFAISDIGISKTHILKALDPIISTLVWWMWDKKSLPVTSDMSIALAVILIGCVLGYGQSLNITSYGAFMVLLSSVMYSVRSVATKRWFSEVDMTVFFTRMSLVSFSQSLFLLPAAGNLRFITTTTSTTMPLLLSVFAFAVYNYTSFLVLSLTNPISHSVLKTGKRILIILVGSLVKPLTILQWFGVILSGVGTAGYGYATKSNVERTSWKGIAFVVCLILTIPLWTREALNSWTTVAPNVFGTNETPSWTTEAPKISRAPKRWVVLLGPHDRFNFGDLLFTKVVARLLTTRGDSVYLESELLYAGLFSVNMSGYGGEQITSLRKVVNMSRQQAWGLTGPFDLVNLGGEALGCTHACGLTMLPTQDQRTLAKLDKISDCAYVIPKRLLLPKSWNASTESSHPVAILNSLGGDRPSPSCEEGVLTADVKAFRNPNSIGLLTPDSAVMVDVLFRDVITSYASKGEAWRIKQNTSEYVAVQMSSDFVQKISPKAIAVQLDKLHHMLNKTAVFFRAGSVPGHDTLEAYHAIIKHMKSPALVFETLHVFSIVAMISRAFFVISTSMHVRIMAFIHRRPRMTLCRGGKHEAFIRNWDASDSCPCHQDMQDWAPYARVALAASADKTDSALKNATQKYLDFFDHWVQLLNH